MLTSQELNQASEAIEEMRDKIEYLAIAADQLGLEKLSEALSQIETEMNQISQWLVKEGVVLDDEIPF